MSGGGSGPDYHAPVRGACETLVEETFLNSPVQAVVSTLKKGDQLEIRVRKVGNASIVEALKGTKTAGSITSAITQKLAECVANGHEYVADVVDNVKGGACKVRVHHK